MISEYAAACLLNGKIPRIPKITAKWWTCWEDEFGLNLRRGNRKYEVPRAVQKQRCEIWWVNLFLVRIFPGDKGLRTGHVELRPVALLSEQDREQDRKQSRKQDRKHSRKQDQKQDRKQDRRINTSQYRINTQ